MNNIKFAHFVENKYTIGYRINDDTGTIDYAVAYAHPNDVYNHKIARNIVSGRILKGGVKKNGNERRQSITFAEYIEATNGKNLNHTDIVSYLDFLRDIDAPSAVEKAALLKLNQHHAFTASTI